MPSSPTDAVSRYISAIGDLYGRKIATEHSYRAELGALLQALGPGVKATNEPKRTSVGAPDYIVTRDRSFGPVTVGYVEAKDIDNALKLDEIERDARRASPLTREGKQLRRYLDAFPNLLFTDYVEFRWYANNTLREAARLAEVGAGGRITRNEAGAEPAIRIITSFLQHQAEPITSARELALRMARLTHLIRDMIVEAFDNGVASDLLVGWREAFAKVLIADLEEPEKTGDFADMFAQTLAYGLFSARIMDRTTPDDFSRREAQELIPRTNPFLREVFEQISGNRMLEEPYAPYVDDLAELLRHADMSRVLEDFGKKTRQEDPVVHFYETFLAAYDPRMREARGVYYTPEPVVSYIVRSVDHLLKTRFRLPDGLADTRKISIDNPDPAVKMPNSKAPKKIDVHRVLVLDPATGTGTFPYAVVNLIRERLMERGNAGVWSNYVREHLLPRIFGFELLMAPYAVAHFKLAFQLQGLDLPPEQRGDWAYDFSAKERIGVFLTNTLEGPHEYHGLPLFIQRVADETNASNRIKSDLPIMVVMGNPPYSGISSNMGDWIQKLIEPYRFVDGQPLGERKLWLQDDYVKFIRFGQWRIERSGSGILAFISNNGYLDNPTFRGMRQSLMSTFSEIFVLDLHGNVRNREQNPSGEKDDNVFDIQQGVTISLFIKLPGKSGTDAIKHASLWGRRQHKYEWLLAHDVDSTDWEQLAPQPRFYTFVPNNIELQNEYENAVDITSCFSTGSNGIQTSRDSIVYGFSKDEVANIIERFRASEVTLPDSSIRDLYWPSKNVGSYEPGDTRGWKVPIARQRLREDANWYERFHEAMYRPLDKRVLFYAKYMIDWPRQEIMSQMLLPNLSLCVGRAGQVVGSELWNLVFVSNHLVDMNLFYRGGNVNFPLYLYPTEGKQQGKLFDIAERGGGPSGRRANLNAEFVAALEKKLGMTWTPDGVGDGAATFGPEDVFNYIYALFHAPTYRERYAEFLKIDFPRVPLTGDKTLFWNLVGLGAQLVALHLMDAQGPRIVRFPQRGDDRVEAVRYDEGADHESGANTRITPDSRSATDPIRVFAPDSRSAPSSGRVWINKTQYFDGVPPEVWEFRIGGYQVAEKWLKDRKGRTLNYDDQTHYMAIIAALAETRRLMAAIDAAIPGWPVG